MVGPELATPRLLLRRWRAEDREPFAALNADPEVMEYFPATLGRAESDALAMRIEADIDRRGFGLWAVEVRDSAEFIGFVGLDVPQIEAHFMPAIEAGWRLVRPAWGHGYATEAARAALAFGFERLELEEIVAMTAVGNARSRAVMARLGMRRDPDDDFDHPKVPVGDPLRLHVLYRISAPEQGRRHPA